MPEHFIAYWRDQSNYWMLFVGAMLFPAAAILSVDGIIDAPFMHSIPWILFCTLFCLPAAGVALRAICLKSPLILCVDGEIFLEDSALPWRHARFSCDSVVWVSAVDGTGETSSRELVFGVTPECYNELQYSRIWSGKYPATNELWYPFVNASVTPTVAAVEIGNWVCAGSQSR